MTIPILMATMEFDTQKFMADIRHALEVDTLRQMAAELENVSASTLSRLDNGKEPDMKTFKELCLQCELNPGDYFHRVMWYRKESE